MMKRLLTAVSLAATLALGTSGMASAQTEPAQEQPAEEEGIDGRWGLLGLLGLFGLFGYRHDKVPVTRGATASRDH